MSIRLCIGDYAKNGYEPEHMGIKLYSLEELCFFIKENAYLIDENFVREDLGEWLEKECALSELGEELKRGSRKQIPVKTFVGLVLDYVGFFEKEETEQIKRIISANSSRSIFEKKKARADALVQKSCYSAGLKEYYELLNILPKEAVHLKGEIFHGCGVCFAKMFYFTKAGEYFLKSYQITGRISSYQQYLWTYRLSVGQEEYMNFLKEHSEAYEDSLEMEETLEELNYRFQQSEKGLLMREIRKKKEEFKVAKYQDLLKERVELLKSKTRRNIR